MYLAGDHRMQLSDKELLELAAKAAGVCQHPEEKLRHSYGNWGCDTTCTVCNEDPSDARWRPLTDDGDALRLVVKLHIAITYPFDEDAVRVWYGHEDTDPVCEPLGGDPYAATRRAIVRAAVEIGKGMP